MARERDKSPSLMDANFPMRRHGIQICLENEQSNTCHDAVDGEDDDDVTFLFEATAKKNNDKKSSRSNSSSSSTGSENNNKASAVNMGKSVSSTNKTKQRSWSSDSSVDDVETVPPPPPPPVPDANTHGRNDEEDVIILEVTRPAEPLLRPPNVTTLRVVDFESDPEHFNSRKRVIDPPSQSYFLDKRRRSVEADSFEVPSWFRGEGEGSTFERRPSTRWDNPSPNSQNTPVQLSGWQLHSTQLQSNLPSTLPEAAVANNRSNITSNGAWTPITLTSSQTNGIHGQAHRNDIPLANRQESRVPNTLSQAVDDSQRASNIGNATEIPLTPIGSQRAMVHGRNLRDDVAQAHHHKEPQPASTWSQANQERVRSNDRGDASLGQTNGIVHEGRSKERVRHSSSNSRRDRSRSKDRSRSRSRSLERRRDSRNRSRSRSPEIRSTSKDRRERRPSGSSYANYSMSKERRVSGNSNHSHSSHTSERGWKNHNERRIYRGSNHRGGGGNGRCTPQSGTAKNYHKPRNENYIRHGNQEWLYNNRGGGYRRGNKWGYNDSGFRNDQRVHTSEFVRGQEFRNTNANQISPNSIPCVNRTKWGSRPHSPTTAPTTNANTTHQTPETETPSSSQRQNSISPTQTRQDPDPTPNVQPQPDKDKEDYYPPVSTTKQRIAHKSAMTNSNRNVSNTTPASASGSNVEQVKQNPGMAINSTQARKPPQGNSVTTNESKKNSLYPNSGKSVNEILKLIKTCPSCYGRIFDDRKKARAHLQSQHEQKLCFFCFLPVSTKGLKHKEHFLEHSNNEESAECPLCREKQSYDGIYIHLAKMHFIPCENRKPKPSGAIRSKKLIGDEQKPKPFSQKPKPKPSSSSAGYQNDRRHQQGQRREQFDPQHSSTTYYKPHSSYHRGKTDRNRQQVVDSELSEKCDASSPEKDRNGNDVEHNLIYAPREDIRAFRIPKKNT